MPKIIEGGLSSKGLRMAVVVSRFNDFITSRLVDGAMDVISRSGGDLENAVLVKVPGAMEISLAAKKLADSGKYDAVICLGAIIRGSTPHFEHVANQSARGLARDDAFQRNSHQLWSYHGRKSRTGDREGWHEAGQQGLRSRAGCHRDGQRPEEHRLTMGIRRKARECVVQMLYQFDVGGENARMVKNNFGRPTSLSPRLWNLPTLFLTGSFPISKR